MINPTNFTDKNFRSYVAKFDTEKSTSGRLTRSELEAEGAKKIDVYDKNIASLKGVEYFAKLETLNCNNNQLTTLDMSKNTALTDLLCFSNQLTSLDVSKNTALTYLNCQYNQLDSPIIAEALMRTLSSRPFLVLIRITPLPARLPYRAAEVASFSTVMLSMSALFKSLMFPP